MRRKECIAQERNRFKTGNARGRAARQRHALQRLAHESRKTGAEKRERQTGCVLIGVESKRKKAKERGHHEACQGTGQETEREAARGVGYAETGHRAHEHHAFDTQVENTAFFVNENADGSNQQGRTRIQRRSNDRSNHTSIHD